MPHRVSDRGEIVAELTPAGLTTSHFKKPVKAVVLLLLFVCERRSPFFPELDPPASENAPQEDPRHRSPNGSPDSGTSWSARHGLSTRNGDYPRRKEAPDASPQRHQPGEPPLRDQIDC